MYIRRPTESEKLGPVPFDKVAYLTEEDFRIIREGLAIMVLVIPMGHHDQVKAVKILDESDKVHDS